VTAGAQRQWRLFCFFDFYSDSRMETLSGIRYVGPLQVIASGHVPLGVTAHGNPRRAFAV